MDNEFLAFRLHDLVVYLVGDRQVVAAGGNALLADQRHLLDLAISPTLFLLSLLFEVFPEPVMTESTHYFEWQPAEKNFEFALLHGK